MIKAVLFDIDGVLIDTRESNIKFYQVLIPHFGYKRPSKKEIMKSFHFTLWNNIKFLTKEKSEEKIRKMWEEAKTLKLYPLNLVKIPPHSKEVIKILHRKYRLGIVTSRVRRGVDIYYRVAKTTRYFDVAVSVEDYSKPKPHPEPLLVAAKRLRIKPSEAVYVGDAESDLRAAKAAGMKVIIYSRKRMKGADANVKSFKEILPAIAKLCS